MDSAIEGNVRKVKQGANHLVLTQLIDINERFLQLKFGAVLDAQFFAQQDCRCPIELVGVVPGKHLIFRFGCKHPPPDIALSTGMMAVFRFLLEDNHCECVAFKSQLMCTMNVPTKLLFFEFPREIQRRELRNHSRKVIELAANLSHKEWQTEGLIKDLSMGGCRFQFPAKEQRANIKMQYVELEFEAPKTNSRCQLVGKVQSSKVKSNHVDLGIAFKEEGQKISQLLGDIIPQFQLQQ